MNIEPRLQKQARKSGKSKEYCEKCLSYAENLWDHSMPVIYTQEHLCGLLGYLPEYVYAAANAPESFYRQFSIPKKNGGMRLISEPLPNLKKIQKWILENILYRAEVSPYAKAYIPGKINQRQCSFSQETEEGTFAGY